MEVDISIQTIAPVIYIYVCVCLCVCEEEERGLNSLYNAHINSRVLTKYTGVYAFIFIIYKLKDISI